MKKTIVLLLALLLVASGLSVFASGDLVDPPYTVKMKAAITAGEGIEPIEPELPGDRPGEIDNGKGLEIVVGRSASKQSLGSEYSNADSLVTLEQYGEGNEIVADLSGQSPNPAAVDNVYFYVAAAAAPSAASSTTVTFSCTDGWVKSENTATPSQEKIPINFAASAFSNSPAKEGYNITTSATNTGTVEKTTSTFATVTVSSPYPATSPTWHFVGEVIAVWPQNTGYQVGAYTADITVAVTTP